MVKFFRVLFNMPVITYSPRTNIDRIFAVNSDWKNIDSVKNFKDYAPGEARK